MALSNSLEFTLLLHPVRTTLVGGMNEAMSFREELTKVLGDAVGSIHALSMNSIAGGTCAEVTCDVRTANNILSLPTLKMFGQVCRARPPLRPRP